ncbi:MAG TPA: phosphoheptose isomerase, partial [Bacteroidia bacterium]|nr:phosphoheptose isomerase [Bacteroidia bacterium]
MKNSKVNLIIKNVHGKRVSPVLPPHIRNYLIDIDGTICEDVPNEEPERMGTAAVFPEALAKLNKWYDSGHIITFLTSRTEEHRAITEGWLKKHGFKYHSLLVGKPRGGNYYWIDNAPIKIIK